MATINLNEQSPAKLKEVAGLVLTNLASELVMRRLISGPDLRRFQEAQATLREIFQKAIAVEAHLSETIMEMREDKRFATFMARAVPSVKPQKGRAK